VKSQHYTFELTSNLSDLKALNEHLVAFGGNIGMTDLCISEVNICLDELFTNIVLYGFNDDLEHKIKFSLKVEDNLLITIMEDDGVPFNPLKKKAVKLPENVDDAQIGGLGIHITKELVDKISYERKGDLNILTIKKSIPINENLSQ
jgi:anti-sigma regulatory factor (Ser/Thr protein kinase)